VAHARARGPVALRTARVWLTLVALLLAVAGCGSAPEDHSKDERIESFDVRRQPAVVQKPGPPTHKVVVYVHGAGERITNAFRDPAKHDIFRALLDGGYALAMTDARGDNWGSPASVQDQLALVAALRERGLRDVYVLALSMGGLDGLQLLGRVPVKAWAGIFPACDLGSVWDVGLYRSQIRAAYGLAATASPRAALRGRSPVSIDPPDGLPMRFWASPEDRVIPARPNTEACAAIARRRGARVEVTTTRGDHGDASNYDAAGVLRLFDSVP
jgi:pimeloyl-ACP methyl ester carboxylesterase